MQRSCDEPSLPSISGNECLSVPDTNQYSKALISALPCEPEPVIYHRCSYESLTLAFLGVFSSLQSCYIAVVWLYKCERWFFSSLENHSCR